MAGGQSGVDRAALDAALERGLPAGGWCPKGRRSEEGPIPVDYPLKETPSADYAQRTEWNVRDSDGTLALHCGAVSGGTALTCAMASRLNRPLLACNLLEDPDPLKVVEWLKENRVHVLNVAGPRESSNPGVYREARDFLLQVFTLLEGEKGRERPSSPAS